MYKLEAQDPRNERERQLQRWEPPLLIGKPSTPRSEACLVSAQVQLRDSTDQLLAEWYANDLLYLRDLLVQGSVGGCVQPNAARMHIHCSARS